MNERPQWEKCLNCPYAGACPLAFAGHKICPAQSIPPAYLRPGCDPDADYLIELAMQPFRIHQN
jgi:hypothetical protein